MAIEQLKIGMRRVWMHKGVVNADFGAESVLSNDPWSFVELWLQRNRKTDALPYWLQARRFSEAAKILEVEAAPLALYYSFLNATKTLLMVRESLHGSTHGVSGDRPEDAKASLSNEIVTFKNGGILPALCRYLGDSATAQEYRLKDLLWNLPFVHRAFRHTFSSAPELFVPLENAKYVKKTDSNEAWFQAGIAPRYCDGRILRSIPSSFECFEEDGKTFVRRKKRFRWIHGRCSRKQKLEAAARLASYHSTIRRIVVPITGVSSLWYIKKNQSNTPPSERHSLAVMFAAMHRLSELSRYDPAGLERHLMGRSNWLITEFIEHAPNQFIDQIASEITGLQFWQPGIRT